MALPVGTRSSSVTKQHVMDASSTARETDDLVILGGGLAGLFCALKLAPRPVTVVTAAPLGEGASSAWAQGGIAAAMSEGDTPEKHTEDTIAAGGGIVDAGIARQMAEEAGDRIRDLLEYGVPFDKDLEGALICSREAAHSERRVVRVKGDQAGRAIMAAIIAAVRNTPSIRVLEGYNGEEITKTGHRATGLVIRNIVDGHTRALTARAIVLATGGIGFLYARTTNPPQACGQGIAMAATAGAVLADCEFVQFHPTAIDIPGDPTPLASEAIRGEGAVLVDRDGHRFMADYHPLADLAPRDIVARAVQEQVLAGRGAFLDCRSALGERFAEHFPSIFAICREAGIDPRTDLIPVTPAAHYHMGGVLVDANGRTSVDGLWACGEVASSGAHGANRLASNSLLESVVFGARIATDLQGLFPVAHVFGIREFQGDVGLEFSTELEALDRLRAVMNSGVNVVRTRDDLIEALAEISAIERAAWTQSGRNAVLAAKAIAVSALLREESRGAHFRGDFPQSSKAFEKRTYITLAEIVRYGERHGGGSAAKSAVGH